MLTSLASGLGTATLLYMPLHNLGASIANYINSLSEYTKPLTSTLQMRIPLIGTIIAGVTGFNLGCYTTDLLFKPLDERRFPLAGKEFEYQNIGKNFNNKIIKKKRGHKQVNSNP